jgi:nickel-dependent lactate racemase
MIIGEGFQDRLLTEAEIEGIVARGLEALALDGKRVLVIVPDGTRTMPVGLFFRLICRHLLGKAQALDFLVALGTHPPLDEAGLLRLVGLSPQEKAGPYRQVGLINHAWKDAQALVTLGTIQPDEIAELSNGLMCMEVPIRLNRLVLEYDHLIICGPVFPHEVVGFSGGNKYFFPGIAGAEVIDFTHWLGALITSYETIGRQDTPIRRVIDRAAAAIPTARHAFCAVTSTAGVHGLYFAAPEAAYAGAAELSGRLHIRWVDRPYQKALAVLPEMYDEMWVGAKGMYKLEPAIADGGEVIIYAPHVAEFSRVHGEVIRQVGFHVRDYFVKQWAQFAHYPWGVLAHSTHVKGNGTYENGVECPRIQVTLATAIPEAECRRVNLGYCDPASIRPQNWAGREAEGVLLVPRAGEDLYRIKRGT